MTPVGSQSEAKILEKDLWVGVEMKQNSYLGQGHISNQRDDGFL